MKPEYAIIVKNKTRLETLIERFNTKAQARFYIERLGGDFADYEAEHETFHQSLASLQQQLSTVIRHKIVERHFLPSYIFSEKNLLVVIGQDGLVANTAKYSNGLPIVAVNPDKSRYDGVLLPFEPSDFLTGVAQVLRNDYRARTARFAEARLNDGQTLLAFNELFIGAATHVSARYRIGFNRQSEEQSSSGMIVSTRAGSTGWLSSVFNMANGLAGAFGDAASLRQPVVSDNELLFAVREPFISVRTQANITAGILRDKSTLTLHSLMPANGVIFSDGIETDFLPFNSGAVATIGLAEGGACLVEPGGI
ncbi:MAG: sugar kinase [Saprospiraceae bacterium]|jgi:NAD kinase